MRETLPRKKKKVSQRREKLTTMYIQTGSDNRKHTHEHRCQILNHNQQNIQLFKKKYEIKTTRKTKKRNSITKEKPCPEKPGSSTERNRSGERSRQRSGQTPTEERPSNRRSRTPSEEKANRGQKCYSVIPGTPFQDALMHIRHAPVVDTGITLKKILVAQSYSDVDLEREMTKLSACQNKWCHCRKSERKGERKTEKEK